MEKVNFDDLVPKLDNDIFVDETQTIDTPIEENDSANSDDNEDADDLELGLEAEKTPTLSSFSDNTTTDNSIKEKSTEEPAEFSEPATLFYQELIDNGIATPQENKESYSWDDVSEVINNYKEELPKQITEQLITSAPKLGQDLIDFVFSKGDSLSTEDLNSFMSQYIFDIQDVNVEIKDVDSARTYLESKYTEQGIRKTQIEVMLDALEDEGEEAMLEEANKFKLKDAEKSKSKQLLNETKQERLEIERRNREFAESLFTELNNTGWKSSRIQRIQQDLSTGKTNELLSKAGNSPKALIQLANLATYYNEKSGEFNFEDFLKQAISPQAKSLRDKITKDMFSTGTTTKEKSSNPNRSRFSDLVPKSPIN
jgi:hypothetical protein